MIARGEFRWCRLAIHGIDNEFVLKMNSPAVVEEETCLFHHGVSTGENYFKILHGSIIDGISERRALPVVRFADGEFAFYNLSLHCNGLYHQAESIEAIRSALPSHIDALRTLARMGKVAPLVFPGNVTAKKKGLFSFIRSSGENPSSLEFINFLKDHQVELDRDNYIPFYVVYAYLTSERFAKTVDGRNVCIINSEYDEESCLRWFERYASRPRLSFVEIPVSYVATRWPSMKEKVLASVPHDTDLCIVGAGVGALLVCVDAAEKLSIPVIDAGHVLNMMNGREDKSKGARLYTMWMNEDVREPER